MDTRVLVDPEPDPRQYDDEHRRNVGLQNEEADLTLKHENSLQARVVSCTRITTANESVPIKLAQCWFPGLASHSINQSVFISGTRPIKTVEKIDSKYLQRIHIYTL